jgi:hypothetical protein
LSALAGRCARRAEHHDRGPWGPVGQDVADRFLRGGSPEQPRPFTSL